MKILLFIIFAIFLFSLAFQLILAEDKNVDVNVVVVNNSSNDSSNSYAGSSGTNSNNPVNFGNNVDSSIESFINENGINQSFNNGANEMFSFKAGNSWTLPLIFLIIIVSFLIIYEVLHHTKKKKNMGKRRRVYHSKCY